MSSAVAARSVKTRGEVDRLKVLSPLYRNLAPVSSSSWSHRGVTEVIVRHTSSSGRNRIGQDIQFIARRMFADEVDRQRLSTSQSSRRVVGNTYKEMFGGFCVTEPKIARPCDVYSSREDRPSLAPVAHSYSDEPHGRMQIVLLIILPAIQNFQVGRWKIVSSPWLLCRLVSRRPTVRPDETDGRLYWLIPWVSTATISCLRGGKVTGDGKRAVSPLDQRSKDGGEDVATDKFEPE